MRSLKPSPPSDRGKKTDFQEIFALALLVMLPFHRNLEQRDSTALMQSFGKMKLENQKFSVPEMIVVRSCLRPTYERALDDQDEKRLLSWSIKVL